MKSLELNISRMAFIFLLLSLPLSIFITQINKFHTASGSDDLWYVGKGAKQNMFLKYAIQHKDFNNGQPFNMTIYLKELMQDTKYWVAPVTVDYDNHHLNGTFYLSDVTLAPIPNSTVPASIASYADAYSISLDWLKSYVNKQTPKLLSATTWGTPLGANEGIPVDRLRQENITVPAGTYDSNVMGPSEFDKFKFWINKDLPYPIKAEFYQGPNSTSQVVFKFEALEIKQNFSAIPEFSQTALVSLIMVIGMTSIILVNIKSRPL